MPVYTYRCPECNYEEELVMKVADLDRVHVSCKKCYFDMVRNVGKDARTQGKPQVLDYYSENLETKITGPKQREAILRSKGLTPVPDSIFKEMQSHTAERKAYGRED